MSLNKLEKAQVGKTQLQEDIELISFFLIALPDSPVGQKLYHAFHRISVLISELRLENAELKTEKDEILLRIKDVMKKLKGG